MVTSGRAKGKTKMPGTTSLGLLFRNNKKKKQPTKKKYMVNSSKP